MDLVTLSKENLLVPLPEFKHKGTWIGGGAVRDSLVGAKRTDVDIFGQSKELLDEFIATNLSKAKKVYDSERVKTFRKGRDKIQIIYIFSPSISACLDRFDFTLCQFAFDGEKIWCNPQSLLDIHRKKIVINRIDEKFAVDSLRRIQKYIQKGYTICSGGIHQLVNAIRAASQEDVDAQFTFYPDGRERIERFD